MFGVYFLVVGDVSGKMKKGKGERKWRLQQRTGRAGGRRGCGSPERTQLVRSRDLQQCFRE